MPQKLRCIGLDIHDPPFYHKAVCGLILYCSRIRKNVTDREKRTENREQTEKPITEAILILMNGRANIIETLL